MLRFEEALARIVALGDPPLGSESIALEDAEGRVLAEDLVATVDLPGFDYSSMDGYAVSSRDLAGETKRLRVRGESRTGQVPEALTPGTTMRIFTGAAVPAGADAIVMQENVTRAGDVAAFASAPRPSQNVRRRGEDLRSGDVAIAKGTRLRPAHLALGAALDRSELSVTMRPKVAILTTGDELRRPGTDPVPGTIPESISVALRAVARRAGATTKALPYVRDDRQATERAFASALEDADVVVSVGGVSVGDHDLVRPALEAVGVVLDFWRVALKPGKPLAIGRMPRANRRDAIVIGLPGNPSSAMTTFAVFGVPFLRALQGDTKPVPIRLRAKLGRAHAHDPGRLELARAVLSRSIEGLIATPLGNQASGAVTTMAQADCFVVIPSEANGVAAGEEVEVVLLSDLAC